MNPSERYDSLFQFYAQEYGLDWKKLKAQAMAESGLNKHAVSKVGAKGISQFMPATFSSLMPSGDIIDPEDSIQCQAMYMKQLLGRLRNDYQLAWSAYDWGIGNVLGVIKKIQSYNYSDLVLHLPEETKNYVARIEKFLEAL